MNKVLLSFRLYAGIPIYVMPDLFRHPLEIILKLWDAGTNPA